MDEDVDVVLDLIDPHRAWRRLGHDFRVMVHIPLWRNDDVVRVPLGALFRNGGECPHTSYIFMVRARPSQLPSGGRTAPRGGALGGRIGLGWQRLKVGHGGRGGRERAWAYGPWPARAG